MYRLTNSNQFLRTIIYYLIHLVDFKSPEFLQEFIHTSFILDNSGDEQNSTSDCNITRGHQAWLDLMSDHDRFQWLDYNSIVVANGKGRNMILDELKLYSNKDIYFRLFSSQTFASSSKHTP